MVSPKTARTGAYEVGQIHSFRTAPVYKFSPSPTGRFAACKILRVERDWVLVVLFQGVFERSPELEQVKNRPFAIDYTPWNRNQPSVTWSPGVAETGLADFRLLGVAPLSAAEETLRAGQHSYASSWDGVSLRIELPWRREFDSAALESEKGLALADTAAAAASARERYEKRLKNLTWGTLLAENPLAVWEERDPPFPPPAFTAAAKVQLRETIGKLSALGPKPKKAAARALLRGCVEWFNSADLEYGRVIETDEREILCAVLEEFAHVAGHPRLAEEVENWRAW